MAYGDRLMKSVIFSNQMHKKANWIVISVGFDSKDEMKPRFLFSHIGAMRDRCRCQPLIFCLGTSSGINHEAKQETNDGET